MAGNCETRTRSVLRRPFRLRTHNRTGGHNWPSRFSSQLLRRPVGGRREGRRMPINLGGGSLIRDTHYALTL